MIKCSVCGESRTNNDFSRNQLRRRNPKCRICIGNSNTDEVKPISKSSKKDWKSVSELQVSGGNSQPGKNAWDNPPKLKCDPTSKTLPQKSSGKKEVRPEGCEIDEFLLGLTIEEYVGNTGKIGNIPLLIINLQCRYALAKKGKAPPVYPNGYWMAFLKHPKLKEHPLFQVNPERFLEAKEKFVLCY